MKLSAGSRLGPYVVVDVLGAGGMGVVYRARDTRLGRDVALKVLPHELSRNPERLERFEREARVVAALNHPNVLAIHDVGVEEGSPYLVFELLDGGTLRERLDRGPLTVRAALDTAAQVALGLAAAHGQGVLHRDLKPENLFLRRDGFAKILDFGLAKALAPDRVRKAGEETVTGLTDPATQAGTAAYMSPEQASGRSIDHRSDLFSLGVVLHEMLSGRNPFRRDTPAESKTAIMREPTPPLPVHVIRQAPGLGAVVARCLEKDPEGRFDSAKDLAFALQQVAVAGETIDRTPERPGFGRKLGAIGGLALVVFAITAVVVFLERRGTPAPPAFRRLTARPAGILSARFSPDGNTVLFTGRDGGHPMEAFEQRLESLEPHEVDLPAGRVVAWNRGEIALLETSVVAWGFARGAGTLVRVPVTGGGARVVAEGVNAADWARDGSAFALVRSQGGITRLEYPPGRTLYATPGAIASPRISPDGGRVAFCERPVRGNLPARLVVVDQASAVEFLTGLEVITGVSWSNDGREVWWARRNGRADCSLEAAAPSGGRRVLLRLPGAFTLLDVGAGGRALLLLDGGHYETNATLAGEDGEQGAAMLYRYQPFLMDLAADGERLLFEAWDDVRRRSSAYLRRAGDPRPVRLEAGEPQSLSPDGRFLTLLVTDTTLRVVPTGAGGSVTLPRGTIARYFNSRWLPDGRRILIAAQEKGRAKRLFLQDARGGPPRPVTPEGVFTMYPAVSPDGQWVAAGPDLGWFEQGGGRQAAWPLGGGEPRPLPGVREGECVVRWTADGRSVFAYDVGHVDPPWVVFQIDLETGRRKVWREIQPADLSGVPSLARVHVTPDGRYYGYTFWRFKTDLYLVTGLR